MRVLILLKFPYFGNGSGNYTRRLAENLSKHEDIEVAIAAPDRRPVEGAKVYTIKPPFRAVFEGHPEWRGASKYSTLSTPRFTKLYNGYLEQIVKIVDDFKPDIIHVNHASYLTWIASYIKSFYGIAYVVTVHGTGIKLATQDRRFRALTRQALERAEQIIAVAPHARSWLLKVFGNRLFRRSRVIPAGVQLSNFNNLTHDNPAFDKKYNTKGKKVALFVGRLTKEKGVEYLIQAAMKIKGEVFIVGEGPEKERLQKLARKRKVSNVKFLGYYGKNQAAALREFYARADVLVLPSVVDESLGLVILEAMAARTPVVASNKGGIPLVVKDGKSGFLVRARSAKAISEAVNRVFLDPVLGQAMATNARTVVAEKFDWAVLTPQIVSIYNKTMEVTKRMQGNLKKERER